MTNAKARLRLSPVTETDRAAIETLLAKPDLSRRNFGGDVRQLNPVAWSKTHRTFGVRLDEDLFGAVHLVRDEDGLRSWELSVLLADHRRALDGARSAVAGLFYAFSVLHADNAWFWAPESNELIGAFAQQLGFTQLNPLVVPGVQPARSYELTSSGWRDACRGALDMFLTEPVTISDHDNTYFGDSAGFRCL